MITYGEHKFISVIAILEIFFFDEKKNEKYCESIQVLIDKKFFLLKCAFDKFLRILKNYLPNCESFEEITNTYLVLRP